MLRNFLINVNWMKVVESFENEMDWGNPVKFGIYEFEVSFRNVVQFSYEINLNLKFNL